GVIGPAACRRGLEVARSGGRCAGDTVGRLRDVVSDALAVECGAAEQELDVEERCPARADAVERMPVLQLADHALGVRHPLLVRPDTLLALAAGAGGERLAFARRWSARRLWGASSAAA